MEVKVYLNRNFPMSLLINTVVEITKDLNYVGSITVENEFVVMDVLEGVFKKFQLQEEYLGIILPRSLSVGDVLSVRLSEDFCTKFYLIDNVGFKKL